jgi:Zn-dependent membrane protease YugP
MYLDSYLGSIGEGLGSLLLLLGALPGIAAMRWATQHYQRIRRQHGAVVAACGLTGELVAQRLLTACGLSEVAVMRSGRRNFYHPRKREIHLDAMNFESPSLSAVTTAAHEVGHAQQFASGILLCRLRHILWPTCYVLIGLAGILPMLHIAGAVDLPMNVGPFMLTAGIAMAVLQLPIKLPLEYDASRRARKLVQEARLLGPGEQYAFDKILKAAWFTHAARLVGGCLFLVVFAAVILLYPNFIGPVVP